MKYISLFSGIEAASCAWEELGWEPVAFSEIEPFPCAVLEHRYPGVPNLGDITQIDWKPYAGSVDVVVGGSPCQSFSYAGGRESLDGESRLMSEYIRAIREIRPRWFVWENVPGALSAKGLQGEKGGAFGCLLKELDELGYGLAWRVLDAQFFGVAQRRRRVFLVGSFGTMRSAEILFEPDCMRWDHPSSREKRALLAADAQRRAGSGHEVLPFDTTQVTSPQNGSNLQWGDPCHPICAQGHTPSVCYAIAGNIIGRDAKNGGNHLGVEDDGAMFTLTTADRHAICMASTQANAEIDEELCATITRRSYKDAPVVSDIYAVRRLMPVECERLQGFPDGWTDIEYRGEPAKDAQRYKSIGNSMPVPVMLWIGKRIEEAAA